MSYAQIWTVGFFASSSLTGAGRGGSGVSIRVRGLFSFAFLLLLVLAGQGRGGACKYASLDAMRAAGWVASFAGCFFVG
jgi:hypothetical protein